MSNVLVAALYKFVPLADPVFFAHTLRLRGQRLNICGTLVLASEGINGTIAGEDESVHAFLVQIRAEAGLHALESKFSRVAAQPFRRLKVHVKNEIVTMGVPGVDPTKQVGTYLSPAQWNELMAHDDVLVIDTRNNYEVMMGTFKNAINPGTTTFREFPNYVRNQLDPKTHKKVAMFCTGGIRCEKASSFMVSSGFAEVYHLQGGILNYLETIPSEQSLWDGDCFVFDRRVAVDHALAPGQHSICDQCQRPLDATDRASALFEQDVSCPYCAGSLNDEQKRTLRARARILPPVLAPLRAR